MDIDGLIPRNPTERITRIGRKWIRRRHHEHEQYYASLDRVVRECDVVSMISEIGKRAAAGRRYFSISTKTTK